MPVVAALILLMLTCSAGRADIYRYVNEDGVECFTDTPLSTTAKVYQRDSGAHRRSGKGSRPAVSQKTAASATRTESPAAAGKASQGASTFSPPLAGRVTSLVGMRSDPFDGLLRHHDGVDIAAPVGSPVRAVAPGVVIFSGTRQGYGNTIIVDHGNGTQSLYAHNARNLCVPGESVDDSTIIALCGSTGRSTGPHLHFEAWRDGVNITSQLIESWQGLDIDPLAALPLHDRIRRAVQPDGTLFFTNLP